MNSLSRLVRHCFHCSVPELLCMLLLFELSFQLYGLWGPILLGLLFGWVNAFVAGREGPS